MADSSTAGTVGSSLAESSVASEPAESEAKEERIDVHPMGVRFEHPSFDEVQHFTRDLEWGERFYYSKMFAHAGNIEMACYCMKDFVESMDAFPGQGSHFLASQDMLADVDELVTWFRDVIGDAALASALDERVIRTESLAGQMDTVIALVKTRYKQYREVIEKHAEETAEIPCAGEGDIR